ncbi:hypothetical protein A9G44_06700 [Gilliamella sp. Occ4-3]|nr:hypothetical protein A9G44_06700 [Gilliamella apicola]
MQVVAFDVADDVAVDVYLVQVSGAVIEVVDGAPVRQGGGDAVAQWVVHHWLTFRRSRNVNILILF